MTTNKKPSYKEFCEQQAQRLLDIIVEHDGAMKWRKTWKGSVSDSGRALPMSKNGYYSGINLTTLLMQQVAHGYASNKWLTYKQIQDQGYCVNKGEKATGVCFFSMKEIMDKETGLLKKIPLLRNYSVFNLCQTNMTAEERVIIEADMDGTITGFDITAFEVVVRHGGDSAHYSPIGDHIQMPLVRDFESVAQYQATLLHELTHWTGGRDSRLPRECAKLYHSDIKQRAKEELVAELGSLFLGVHFKVESDVKNHASYIASWKRDLTIADVAEAVKMATKAFKFIVDGNERAVGEMAA